MGVSSPPWLLSSYPFEVRISLRIQTAFVYLIDLLLGTFRWPEIAWIAYRNDYFRTCRQGEPCPLEAMLNISGLGFLSGKQGKIDTEFSSNTQESSAVELRVSEMQASPARCKQLSESQPVRGSWRILPVLHSFGHLNTSLGNFRRD